MDIHLLTAGHPLWDRMIAYAAQCPWSAGPYLAREMKAGAFTGWERVVCACEGDRIVGFCNFTEKDELPDKYPFSPFIGFVYVEPAWRGHRISEKMIDTVSEYAGEIGFSEVYLMSSEKGLYEKYGFEKIGDYDTIFGTVDQLYGREVRAVSPEGRDGI